MKNMITVEFPPTTSRDDLEALQSQIQGIETVEDAGVLGGDRSVVDPATLGLWIQAASAGVGVVGAIVPIVQKIVEMVKGKGITGAKITLSNGTVVSVDSTSAKDLEKLLKALNEQPPARSSKKG